MYLLLFSRYVKKPHADQSIQMKRKERTQKPSKVAASKNFSPVCMLLIQLASINVFYSMWGLEVIVFIKVCYFNTEIFSTVILFLSLEQVIWEKSVFNVISAITAHF